MIVDVETSLPGGVAGDRALVPTSTWRLSPMPTIPRNCFATHSSRVPRQRGEEVMRGVCPQESEPGQRSADFVRGTWRRLPGTAVERES